MHLYINCAKFITISKLHDSILVVVPNIFLFPWVQPSHCLLQNIVYPRIKFTLSRVTATVVSCWILCIMTTYHLFTLPSSPLSTASFIYWLKKKMIFMISKQSVLPLFRQGGAERCSFVILPWLDILQRSSHTVNLNCNTRERS